MGQEEVESRLKPFEAPCSECGKPSQTLVCRKCYERDYRGDAEKIVSSGTSHRHNGVPYMVPRQ